MSFWKNSLGEVVQGNKELAFAPEIENVVIPNNTTAKAIITKFELIEKFNQQYYDAPYYEVSWELLDGEFKGCQVKQKIKAFEREPKTKDRALEMLMLMYKIANISPPEVTPTNFNLTEFNNKVFGIKVREWQQNDKEGNFVSEIHAATNDFKTESGKKLPKKVSSQSANLLSEYDAMGEKDKDIPF